jgi:3-hydroxyacyl-CoA dehydrogenase
VVMRDVETEFVEDGLDRIDDSLGRLVSRESLTEASAAAAKRRIAGTTDLADLGDVDLVVEAVLEQMDMKQDVFAALDEITPEGAVLATNTSTLSVTTIAAATERPGDVVGLHFMNPVPVMEGVEVVRAETTADPTVSLVNEFADSLDKTTWESADRPGFVVNRVLIPWVCEGIRAYDEGVASKEDVDTGLKLGTNAPMGPLELGDHIGLDVVLDAAETLHDELGDNHRPPVLLRRKVDAGHLGKKTGRGFYDYAE